MNVLRKIVKLLLIFLTMVLLWPVLPYSCRQVWIRNLRQQVLSCNSRELLGACRELIDNRDSFLHESVPSAMLSKNSVMLIPEGKQTLKNLPKVIGEMEPTRVIIESDHVYIRINMMLRFDIVGFSTNAHQFGREKVCDGLWLIY